MEGCPDIFRALCLRLPPCAADDVIEDELALDICSATKANVFLHPVHGQLDAIVPAMDAVEIGDNSALPAFMGQMNWRASGLRLMVGPRTEPLGSNWIGLEVEQLTCDVGDLTYHVQFSHAHITIGTYTEGRRFQQRVRKAEERIAWKMYVGHTDLLLAAPIPWQADRPLVWDLRLEQAVTGTPGISHLVRELESGFKPLGYVYEARTMLYEWGPTLHLSALLPHRGRMSLKGCPQSASGPTRSLSVRAAEIDQTKGELHFSAGCEAWPQPQRGEGLTQRASHLRDLRRWDSF